jgi:hypothetical protein
MNKKIFIIIEGIFACIYLALVSFFMVYFKMNEKAYEGCLFSTMGFALINCIYGLILALKNVTLKSFAGIIVGSICVISGIFHYILKYAGHFVEYRVVYWVSFWATLVAVVAILTILAFKLEDKKPIITRNSK